MAQVSDGIKRVLEATEAILPEIAAAAKDSDEDRRVRDDIIEKLRQTGAMGLSKPERFGGLGANAREMLEVSTLVGRADAGASWVVMLTNVCGWLTGHMSHDAQQDVWGGSDPDPVLTGVLMPTSTARKVEGGYRISGKWHYNSGSWWSDWAGIGFPVPDENGEIVNVGLAIIPRSDYTIEDTWYISGMRGSASNTIVAEDVFVPDHRTMLVPPAIEGEYPSVSAKDEPVYRSGFIPVLAVVLVGPSLGAAEAALEYVREKAQHKPVSQTFFDKQSDSTAVQLQVAKAAQLIETARLLTFDVADRIDAWGREGVYPEPLERARIKANVGFIAESLHEAVETLMWAHGSGSYADSNPLQRLWRDVHVGTSHAVASPAIGYETYGKLLLGNENSITPMI
jgi:alkylation response protein AidB-like acyl-CoA dehydrogenase